MSSRGPDASVATSFVSTDRVTAGRERPIPSPQPRSRPRPRTRGSTYASTASRSTSTWRSTRRLRLRARPFAPPGTPPRLSVSGTTSAEKLKRKCAPTPSAALRQNLSRTKTRSGGSAALASPSLASSVTDRASPKSRRIAPATRFASAKVARVAESSAAEKENGFGDETSSRRKSRVGVSTHAAAARRSASAQASRSRRPPLGAASTSLPPLNTRSNSPPPPAFQRGARETTRASARDAAK